MIQALLWDLDGVLVNAMPLHEEAFLIAVHVEGKIDLTQQEHAQHYAGLPTKVKVAKLITEKRLDPRYAEAVVKAKQHWTQEFITYRVHPDPSRIALLEHFQSHFRMGCVTNCIKKTTMDLLERSQLLKYVRECIVTNEDALPKPSPEPYQKACGLLEVDPKEALVFEDHDVGMTSAFSAGCQATQIKTYEELTVERVWDAIKKAELYLEEPDLPETPTEEV